LPFKKPTGKPRRRVEDCHQIAYFNWLTLAYPHESLVTAGIFNQGKRNQIYAYQMGLKAGMPDIVMFVARGRFHGLMIELKRPEDKITRAVKVSRKQAAIHHLFREQDYCVAVCFGWTEAKDVTTDYLRMR
jgi:hypothetical protein